MEKQIIKYNKIEYNKEGDIKLINSKGKEVDSFSMFDLIDKAMNESSMFKYELENEPNAWAELKRVGLIK